MNLAQKLVGEKIPKSQPMHQQKMGSKIAPVIKRKKVKHAND